MKLPEGSSRTLRLATGNRIQFATCWQEKRLALLWLAAIALPLLVAIFTHQIALLRTFAIAALCLQVWHMMFRHQTGETSWFLSYHDLLHAVLLAMLLPLDMRAWIIVVCTSFGSVFADRLFGGRGFAFLHPVVVALSFQLFSAGISLSETPVNSVPVLWLLPGALGLTFFSLISFRTVLGMMLAALLLSSITVADTGSVWLLATSGPICLVLLFLAANPANGAATNPGRWVYGVLCGVLLVVLTAANPDSLAPVVFTVLLASLSAPLIDYIVVQMYAWRQRTHRYG